MIQKLIDQYSLLLEGTGMSDSMIIFIEDLTTIALTVILAIAADFITKKIIISFIGRIVKSTKNEWDDILLNRKVFNRLAHLAPALIVYYSLSYIFGAPALVIILEKLTKLYMTIIVLFVIDALINVLHEIYNRLPVSRGRNIKGIIQVVKIIIYFIGALMIIAIFTNKELTTLLAGLGAMAAVLILVFKDTILGLVASIQLSANNMVKLGDWIAMPQYHADGDVIDISLTTVKVQNWDKTIATIPTYALVSESFNNWKGMEESGGRRIKRSVNIDMKSVSFLNPEELENLKKYRLLKDYITDKEKELEEFNASLQGDDNKITNGRRLTNLGTFRKYLENYLNDYPALSNNMTLMVRHLQPTEKGIPMEIYAFSREQDWVKYESIQADIIDHILAIMPEFGLKVFQYPTNDLRGIPGE